MEISTINGCGNLYSQNYADIKNQINFRAITPIEDTFEIHKPEKKGFDFAKAIRNAKERILQLYCLDKPSNTKETEEEKYIKYVYSDVVKEMKLQKELQPELYIKPFKNDKNFLGAFYNPETHSIWVNKNNKILDIENVLMHEMTHSREKIKRAGIPQTRVEELIKNKLTSEIKEVKTAKIPVASGKNGNILMMPPIFPEKMKQDFINFAQESLYKQKHELSEPLKNYYKQDSDFSDLVSLKKTGQLDKDEAEIFDKVIELSVKHPEFQQQYESKEEALNELFNYSISQIERYNVYTNTPIRNSEGNIIKVKELQDEELKEAEKSLIDFVKTAEANARIQSGDMSIQNLIQYTFDNEEVLAQINGNSYLIKFLEKKLEEIQGKGKLEEEINLKEKIEDSKRIIEIMQEGSSLIEKRNDIPQEEFLSKIQSLISEQQRIYIKKMQNGNPSVKQTVVFRNEEVEELTDEERHSYEQWKKEHENSKNMTNLIKNIMGT